MKKSVDTVFMKFKLVSLNSNVLKNHMSKDRVFVSHVIWEAKYNVIHLYTTWSLAIINDTEADILQLLQNSKIQVTTGIFLRQLILEKMWNILMKLRTTNNLKTPR